MFQVHKLDPGTVHEGVIVPVREWVVEAIFDFLAGAKPISDEYENVHQIVEEGLNRVYSQGLHDATFHEHTR